MKKILIIQLDEPYFLFETLLTLERGIKNFNNNQLTILVSEKSYLALYNDSTPLISRITFDQDKVKQVSYDLSINLSLNESSWKYHSEIISPVKKGFYFIGRDFVVTDLWASYLLTLKSKAPFLTFHLQYIYSKIIGISITKPNYLSGPNHLKQIAYGFSSVELISSEEQENIILEINKLFPHLPIKDISEIDLIDDLSKTIYIGPANLDALKICSAGARGIFLVKNFQGFNFVPYNGNHLIISGEGKKIYINQLINNITEFILGKKYSNSGLSQYTINHEFFSGAHLQSLYRSDFNYPVYQAHLILWAYLLDMNEIRLNSSTFEGSQINYLKNEIETLNKLIRLYDYAMASIDGIYLEAKSSTTNPNNVNQFITKLQEIENITDQISQSDPYLRPILDFYRIRRSQNFGQTLLEQSQHSLFTYAEEHQALKVLQELFSVTLRENEANI